MSVARRHRRFWWLAFGLYFALAGLWSLSTPLYGGPDEPAHVVKAAAVVRAQLVGDQVAGGKGFERTVRVPAEFAAAQPAVDCWRFELAIPANCAEPSPINPTGDADVLTTASRHPPFYYAPVGVPALLGGSSLVVHLMRLVSAAMAAFFIANAFDSTRRQANPTLRLVGLGLTLTPSIVAWSALVNPSAVEITASVCLISTLLVIGKDPAGVSAAMVRRGAVAAIAMALSRHLAPLWLAVIAVVFLALFGIQAVKTLLGRTDARRGAAAAVAAAAVQLLWVVIVQPFAGIDDGTFAPVSIADAFRGALGMGERNITHLVGVFGWNNPRAPYGVEVIWLMAVGLLLFLAVAVGGRRAITALTLAGLALIGLPVLIETYQASEDGGFLWQARYTAPIAVLLPLIAAHVCAEQAIGPALANSRLVRVVAASMWFGHVGSYWAAVRRFSVGTDGSWIWMVEPNWRPPLLPAAVLFALFTLTAVAFAALFSGSIETALRFGRWSASPTAISPSQPSSRL